MPVKPSMLDYLDDPETEKKFKRFLRKEKRQKNLPSEEEKEEIKKLERQALGLWRMVVKLRAGRKCEACGKKKRLQSHHIEGYTWNKALRYDIRNGLCLCPTCHRFGWRSVHHSFCTLYKLMIEKHLEDLKYLLEASDQRIVITKDFLLEQIEDLENETL